MKVVLLEDVEKLGKQNDVVEVANGYGRNFLIRRGLAAEATKENLNRVKQQARAREARDRRELEEAKRQGERLDGSTFKIPMKVGEGGRLYGALTTIDIAERLEKEGYDVDKRNITLDQEIKGLGRSTATVKLHSDVTVTITIDVVEEK